MLNSGMMVFLMLMAVSSGNVYSQESGAPAVVPIGKRGGSDLETARPGRKHPLEDDWFWFDPYPGPGHMQSGGEGWGFVRLAAYRDTQELVEMTDVQKKAASDVYQMYRTRQPGDTAGRVAHWNEARATIEPLLSASQIRRLDQVALQRMTYRCFSSPRVIESLALTRDQQQQIREAIINHSKRLGDNRTLPDKERIPRGQQSHKQVWTDVRKILTPTQIRIFNDLRGAKPK